MIKSILDLVGLGFDEGDVVLVLLGPGLDDALDLAVSDRGERHDYETSIILMIKQSNTAHNKQTNTYRHSAVIKGWVGG